jgi:4-hydroxybenzoate polyprenyltransferase
MGWAALRGDIGWPPVLLYLGGIAWTLGYDTIYAHQDKEDDARIGIKSSALALGPATRPFLFAAYAIAALLWAAAMLTAGLSPWALLALAAGTAHLLWQAARVEIDDAADCLAKFRSNRWVGWIVLGGIVLGRLA